MQKLIFIISTLLLSATVVAQDSAAVRFEPIGGVYEKPTTVKLFAEEGATIYYTTNTSTPGSGSRRYSGPIQAEGVMVIRAVSYKNGKRSQVYTHTYVCDRPYDLPVVSLVTDTANLWNYSSGIYVKGCCADTIEPYLGANFWKDWEKRANVEMYDENGELCFNQPCGIGIFGGFSRMLPMKSIAVFARSRYGDNRFRYPIFKEKPHITKYKSFILRNSGGDFKRTHIRDAFMTQLAAPTGVAYQAYQPAVVFINGQYWGIQNIREKINEHYLKYNYGVDKNNVDILRQNGVCRHGTSKNYKRFLAWLRNNSLEDDQKVEELKTFMDVDDFIRYNIAEVYSDNRDAGGNIRYWRERNDSAKWRWVFYDLDLGLGNNEPKGYKRNTLRKFTSVNNEVWPDPPWSTFIIRSLLVNKKLEHQYINTFADHLNTVYHPDTANRLLDKMVDVIDNEMKFHQKRWGASYKNWQHHLSILRNFITVRPHFCRLHLMEKFELKDTLNIEVVHPGKEFCDIRFNSLDLDRSFKGIYFKDVPVQISVTTPHDYEFIGWKDGSKEGAVRKVVPTKDLLLEPIIKARPLSALKDSVIFNEIAFYQTDVDSTEDWIELYNRSTINQNLSGWILTDKTIEEGWMIPEGTEIKPGEYLVLCQSLVHFRHFYSADSIQAIGDFGFGFSSKGELIKLYDANGAIVDSVNFKPWIPEKKQKSNYTLALSHPDSSFSNAYWKIEEPTPSYNNLSYQQFLRTEADKRYWTRVFYIGGGSFFFILVVGLLLYRYYKTVKRRK